MLQTNVYSQALVRHFKIMLLQTILTLKTDLTYFNYSKIEHFVFIFSL